MAKANNQRSGVSKVRLVVFEAEVSDGDISQFTQAIQNALQPRAPQARIIHAPASRALASDVETDYENLSDDGDESEVDEIVTARQPRPSKPRAIKPPKVLDGVDWDSDPGLQSFVDQYDIKTDFERYLAVALWFREHRDIPAITTRHVYTAFRQLNWSTSIPDFAKPFRNLVQRQLFTGGAKEGFSINQLGEGKIKAKRRAID